MMAEAVYRNKIRTDKPNVIILKRDETPRGIDIQYKYTTSDMKGWVTKEYFDSVYEFSHVEYNI